MNGAAVPPTVEGPKTEAGAGRSRKRRSCDRGGPPARHRRRFVARGVTRPDGQAKMRCSPSIPELTMYATAM